MPKMKAKEKHKKYTFKLILFLLTTTLLVIPNIYGKSLKPNETNKANFKAKYHIPNPMKHQDTATGLKKMEQNPNNIISWTVIFAMSTIGVLSPYLNLLWIRFLKDQPLNKQCALNCLSRDLIRTNLLFCWTWSVSPILFKILEISGFEGVFKEYAHGVSLLTEALFFILMMHLLLIGFLRLFTLRYNVLDPVEEFFGKGEDVAVTCIRLLILSAAVFMLSVLVICSVKPYSFYRITNQHLTWKDTPRGTQIQHIFDNIFLTVCGIVFMTARVYQRYKYYSHDSNTLKITSKCNRNLDSNDETTYQGEEFEADEATNIKTFAERVSLPALLYIGTAFPVIIVIILEYLEVLSTNIWWILTPLVGMLSVFIPLMICFWYDDLKEYFRRQMKCDIDGASRSIQDILSSLKLRQTRVSPLQ